MCKLLTNSISGSSILYGSEYKRSTKLLLDSKFVMIILSDISAESKIFVLEGNKVSETCTISFFIFSTTGVTIWSPIGPNKPLPPIIIEVIPTQTLSANNEYTTSIKSNNSLYWVIPSTSFCIYGAVALAEVSIALPAAIATPPTNGIPAPIIPAAPAIDAAASVASPTWLLASLSIIAFIDSLACSWKGSKLGNEACWCLDCKKLILLIFTTFSSLGPWWGSPVKLFQYNVRRSPFGIWLVAPINFSKKLDTIYCELDIKSGIVFAILVS